MFWKKKSNENDSIDIKAIKEEITKAGIYWDSSWTDTANICRAIKHLHSSALKQQRYVDSLSPQDTAYQKCLLETIQSLAGNQRKIVKVLRESKEKRVALTIANQRLESELSKLKPVTEKAEKYRYILNHAPVPFSLRSTVCPLSFTTEYDEWYKKNILSIPHEELNPNNELENEALERMKNKESEENK